MYSKSLIDFNNANTKASQAHSTCFSWLRFYFEERQKFLPTVEHNLELLVLLQIFAELYQLGQDSFQLGQD